MLMRGPRAFVTHYLSRGAGEYEVRVEYSYEGHMHTLRLDKRWRFSLN